MKTITVIGAGTMGHGIAHVAALAGFDTTLTDADAGALEPARKRIEHNLEAGVKRGKVSPDAARAAIERLRLVTEIPAAVGDADLVIEAIVEDLAAKVALFGDLDRLAGSDAILATNTSSLSVTDIAAATARPDRIIGMHFFNPVHIMKLVELVRTDATSDATVARTRDVAGAMAKEPIVVRDSPGFASSRLGVVLGLEAMRMVEQGVATAADIDKALELGYGHPMGPLRVTDLVGLDVRLAIAEYLHRELGDDQYAVPDILRRMVAAGELGKKTGRGFYEWRSSNTS